MPNLEESICKVFGHDWDYTGSGEARRPKCHRCKGDYIEWLSTVLDQYKLHIKNEQDLSDTL